MKHKITTDGITDGVSPFEIISYKDPFKACIIEFFEMLRHRHLPTPKDLTCINGKKQIIFEYSFLEGDEFKEKVKLTFNVEKL